jgi:hypothetical protein
VHRRFSIVFSGPTWPTRIEGQLKAIFFAALASDRPAIAWAMLKDGSREDSVMKYNVSRALMGTTSGR